MSYAATAERTANTIKKKGRLVTLSKTTANQNRQTGVTAPSTVQQDVYAVFTNYSASQIDGSTVQMGDKRLLIASSILDNPITTDWRILDGIETWNIVGIEEVQPGDTSILYKVQVRR